MSEQSNYYCNDCQKYSESRFYTSYLQEWLDEKHELKAAVDYLTSKFWVNSVINYHENFSESTNLRFLMEHIEHNITIERD